MGSSKQLTVLGTGYPGNNDTWRTLNSGLNDIFTALARLAGHKTILYGIIDGGFQDGSGNINYTSGYVAWNGDVLPFESGVLQDTVTIVETTVSAEYDNGATNGGVNTVQQVIKTRYMRFGTGGVTTFPFSDLVRLSTIKNLSAFTLPADLVHDYAYVHTDNNLTDAMISAWNAIVGNVQADWNGAGLSAILNKPTNLVTYLYKNTIIIGDVNNGDYLVQFPSVGTTGYQVLATLEAISSTQAAASATVNMVVHSKSQTSFKFYLRETGNFTQNIRITYYLIPLN